MKFYVLPPESVYVFCTDQRANGDYLPTHNQLIDFYKRAEVRLVCGRQRIFKFNSGQPYSVKGTAVVENI